MNKEIEITPVPEVVADTRRVCEIRFDWMVKHADPCNLGMIIKEMFHQLEQTIEQYEQSR